MKDIFDGWPLLDDQFDFNQNAIVTLIKYRKVGLSPLFSVYVSSNPTDPRFSIIRVLFYQLLNFETIKLNKFN
jgi:hypothetical protein